jgi:hypothetical protein
MQAVKNISILAALAAASGLLCLLVFGTGKLPLSNAASSSAAGPDLTALPLGDGKTTTTSPQQGFLYQCRIPVSNQQPSASLPWIHGSTYNLTQKAAVSGSVAWPTASFHKKVAKKLLKLSSNGLPTDHNTGNFPIRATDPAYQYDRNPSSISAQSIALSLALHPKKLKSPGCVGGEVGLARNGVAIFSATDAANRDAVAHEVQDACSGHPQMQGLYHYHGLPACISTGAAGQHSSLIGWAKDGFPIYGPLGKNGVYLSNADLDECHGITEKIKYMGVKQKLFHYVANYEFPYTVGCFRGQADTSPGF